MHVSGWHCHFHHPDFASRQCNCSGAGNFPVSQPLGSRWEGPGKHCRAQAVWGHHLVQGEPVERAMLHRDVVHLVGLQGHASQGPVGLLARRPRQSAPEVGVLALAELSVLQGLKDGHLRNCTG